MEQDHIFYSQKYYDDKYEYRHCELRHEGLSYAIINYERDSPSSLPEMFLPLLLCRNKGKLLSETQWRGLGITMSMGWQHYLAYKPNPTVLCFRRPRGTDSRTGLAPKDWEPYDGEVNIWAIESFEAGDEIWVKEQLAEPLYTIEEDDTKTELKEGTRLMVIRLNNESGDIFVKREAWPEGKWINNDLLHTLTKYGPGQSRKPIKKKRKMEVEKTEDRAFGKNIDQQITGKKRTREEG